MWGCAREFILHIVLGSYFIAKIKITWNAGQHAARVIRKSVVFLTDISSLIRFIHSMLVSRLNLSMPDASNNLNARPQTGRVRCDGELNGTEQDSPTAQHQ